jgi:hypothetical protein
VKKKKNRRKSKNVISIKNGSEIYLTNGTDPANELRGTSTHLLQFAPDAKILD